MSQSGRTCRKRDRAGIAADEAVELELSADKVVVRMHGRVVGTLTGADADAIRAANGDPARLDRVLARTGITKRGGR